MSELQTPNSESSLHNSTYIVDLHRACRTGDLESIKAACKAQPSKINGKDIGVRNIQLGWTPLFRTIICSHYEAASFLLENSADPNIPNNLGETPLHQAADTSQYLLADLLLKYSANPNIVQNDGETPLHHAAFRSDGEMVFGRTPLHSAVNSGSMDVIQKLLHGKADPYLQDKEGRNSFDIAQDHEIVQLLANLNSENSGAGSPLTDAGLRELSEQEKRTTQAPPILGTFGAEHLRDALKTTETRFTFESIEVKNSQLRSLYEWLWKANLPQIYDLLIESGYDDIGVMAKHMAGPLPITEQQLKNVGILRVGHRLRLLLKLKEEAGLVPRREFSKNDCRSILQCCSVPSNSTASNNSLLSALEEIKLDFLYTFFEEAGLEDYDSILSLMSSDTPITDEILKTEVKVVQIKYRERIIRKFKLDAKECAVAFDDPKAVSCSGCLVM